MASSELPFANGARNDTSLFSGTRLSRRKRSIFLLLIVALFFVLLFSSDLNRVQNAVSSSNVDAEKEKNQEYKPVEDIDDDVLDDELTHFDSATSTTATTTTTTTTTTTKATFTKKPTETKPTNVRPPPDLTVETPEDPKQQHYKYFILIASDVSHASRRQLIRSKYFGLNDNLEPCMKRDKGVNYLFWLYGELPHTRTAERRSYETERMEWNDFIKLKTDAFDQNAILKWAKEYFEKNLITFDFLIIQDTYSFTQLNYIQQTLDAEKGKLPVTISPTNFIWYSPQYESTIVAGKSAFDSLWEYESDIVDIDSDATLLSKFYTFGRAVDFEKKTGSKSESDRLTEYFKLPIFLGEKERFTTWSNSVESVADMTVFVANVYQDSDFDSLSQRLHLGGISVCKVLEKSNIAVVSSSYIYPDSCMERAAPLAADNKREYAMAHNYAFVSRSTEFAQQALRADKRRPVWGKIDVVQKVLPKYDWIFWLDMDAVIMNPEHTFQSILDTLRSNYPEGPRKFEENIDLVIAKPTKDKMINAGVFFMRNTEWAQTFLRDVQDFTKWYNQSPSYEQGAMWELIQLNKHKPHVLLLENDDHTFNTLPKRYIPGDFVVHFAPDKCPGPSVLKGLDAAKRIKHGETVSQFDD